MIEGIAGSIAGTLFGLALFFICFVSPFALTVINILNLFRKNKIKEKFFDITTLLLGLALTALLLSTYNLKYYEPITEGAPSLFDKYYEPFSSEYGAALAIPVILGTIGMLMLEMRKILPPLATVICIDFVIVGMIFSGICLIHFFPDILIMLLPFNYIIIGIRLIKETVGMYLEHMSKNCIIPKSGFLMKWYEFLSDSGKLPAVIFGFLIITIALMFGILVLLGQGADGFVKLFTDTADWTFSQQIPPPPVEYEGHYLCTVAAGGHKRIVKPQRIGYRQHTKIIVNRQLCIANAFEQLTEEKMPKIHGFIRRNYDKYGYPLSKHITTPLRADIVYLLMKPLEWFFLIILYIFEINPEKRIAMQYTKK